MAGLRRSKAVSKKVVLLGRRLRECTPRGLAGHRKVDLDVSRTCGDRPHIAASNYRARESRFVPVEVVLVTGLAAGQRNGLRGSLAAAGKDAHPLRHADVHLRGKAVSEVAGHGKPARGIEQVG